MLVNKGYMELEETLMHWKQKSHLMRVLEPLDAPKEEEDFMTKFMDGRA